MGEVKYEVSFVKIFEPMPVFNLQILLQFPMKPVQKPKLLLLKLPRMMMEMEILIQKRASPESLRPRFLLTKPLQ